MKDKIINHFKVTDPILFAYITNIEVRFPTDEKNYLSNLCEIIIQQQLSEKAGATIFNRFRNLFPDKTITAEALLSLSDRTIKASGPSTRKVMYLKNIASSFLNRSIPYENFIQLGDEEVISHLVKIKGIGRWSAQMFLMSSLARPDVFSYGDLGLRKAIQKMYKLKKPVTENQAETISSKWKPYRTYACRVLWNSLITA